MKYDVCVIGAGPSGYAAAIRALDLGKKVALIEKKKVGGAGVFNGALSSKTLWEISERYKMIHQTNLGYSVYGSDIDFERVLFEMKKAIEGRFKQLTQQLDFYERKRQVDFFQGIGKLTGKHSVSITNEHGSIQDIQADNIVVAVGSSPRKLPSIDIDEKHILTSDGINNLTSFPKSMVILGAGVIGCEFATIFSNFGKTQVYLIDKAQRILPFEDDDVAGIISTNFEQQGVHIHKGASLVSMEVRDGKVEYVIEFDNGNRETRTVEKALVSVGRVPNTQNIGLKELGLEMNNRGYCLDADTQTNIPYIYAVGDVTADIALVNVAELEGRHAIEKMFLKNMKPLVYDNISTIMFLCPEVAAVGMNETQARQKKIGYKLAGIHYKYVPRAMAMREEVGYIKLLVSNDEEMKVLGMRVVGQHASSTIEAIAVLILLNQGISVLAETIHPHPSIPEGVQECARMLMGKSILKPEVFLHNMFCYKVDEEGVITNLSTQDLNRDILIKNQVLAD